MQVTTAIAQHLNVLESAIVRCEEWAKVLFVVVRGIGGRFVSKKVAKMEKQASIKITLARAGQVNIRLNCKAHATAYLSGSFKKLIEFLRPEEKAWFNALPEKHQADLKEMIIRVDRFDHVITTDENFVIVEEKSAQSTVEAPSKPKPVKKISKARQWDNIHNEGGEGYNPYRNW